MKINKPTIGILPCPFIDKNNKIKNTMFTNMEILKILKNNNINFIIIPYSLNKNIILNLLNSLDGFFFPGNNQLGNLYKHKEIKKHFKMQKFIINKIKKINNFRIFPVLSICHGYDNLILNELKINNNSLSNFFLNVNAGNAYKIKPNFTKKGIKFKKIYNKSRKVLHNNSLGISPKTIKKINNIDLIATSIDRNNKKFVEIIKFKKNPFYGFQGHPERNNKELFIPFIKDVKFSFSKNKSCQKTLKKITKSSTVLCKNYNLAKKTSKRKCCFYKNI